jgi:hypothetical protein
MSAELQFHPLADKRSDPKEGDGAPPYSRKRLLAMDAAFLRAMQMHHPERETSAPAKAGAAA